MSKQSASQIPHLPDNRILEDLISGTNSFDPLGSYTGRMPDRYEQPVQDADDL